MAMKCLNCGSPAAAGEEVCISCGAPIHNTDPKLRSSGGGGASKFATVFMIIGIVIYNSVIGPQLFPSKGGGINTDRILVAGVVGAMCGAVGLGLGKLFCSGS